jgi:hypothetical protein|tara:strand:- start:926 stop:1393 length:468 start_codon:yes stop_codon:yes gene_type:complete
VDKKFQKLFLIIFFLFSCNSTNADNDLVVEQKDSEDVLIEIMESYRNFSLDPDKAVETIWNNAHKDNKEVTGPIGRFKSMLISAPYNAIVDLTDYSYEVIQEDGEMVHYEIKILNNKNEYFVVTWVFTYDECEISEGLCWQTIGVSPPMYFDSGI